MPTYTILQRYLYRGNRTWYGRINDGGKISYLSLKTKRKADAQAWLDQKNAARFLPEFAKKEEQKHDIFVALNEFADFKEKILDGSGSLETYRAVYNGIRKIISQKGIRFVEELNAETAQELTNEMAEIFNAVTLRQRVSVFGAFAKWAFRKYCIERNNPFSGVEKPRIVKRAKEFWKPEEVDRILDNAQTPALRLEWAFMAFAGLRRHEASKVQEEDIKEGVIRVIGKGNKEAFVPISERLQHEIERAGGIIHDSINERNKLVFLKTAAKNAGIGGNAHPHKFRHSFVSNLIRAKVDPKRAQVLARHSQITTTLNIYSHLLQEDLTDAVNVLK